MNNIQEYMNSARDYECKQNMNLLKSFISNARDYEHTQNNGLIIHDLLILSRTEDLSVFDTSTLEATEFYVLLHELLTKASAESELVWSIITCLETAVRNPTARAAIVHNYHFIHPLTILLDSRLTKDRKLTILKLIQELSYGVVILWQAAHLPHLISLLLDIISGEDGELTPVALGVLVNICHHNKPAIYTLRHTIDIKPFLRRILRLQKENMEISVHVCKLLMILNQLSGKVPDREILNFVQLSFIRIIKAFDSDNMFLMRHIIDFFRDAQESDHAHSVLLTYPKYKEQTSTLIRCLKTKEPPNSWQCVHQMFLFLHQLVGLELTQLVDLYSQIAQAVVPWLQMEGVMGTGLELLALLLRQTRHKHNDCYEQLSSCITARLEMIVEMLHGFCSSSSLQEPLVSLLLLFRELVADSSDLSSAIAGYIEKEQLKRLLFMLMPLGDGSPIFQQTATTAYVQVLGLISDLSLDNKEWLYLYSDLLQKKEVLKALSVGLLFGSYEIKKQVLIITGTSMFSRDHLSILCQHLADMNQTISPPPKAASHSFDKDMSASQSFHQSLDFLPSSSIKEMENLDKTIEKLETLSNQNQLQNASTASIIELYSYKVSEMRRAERWLQSSLAAADTRNMQLGQRVAQMTAETGRLHQLLYCGQQSLEGSQAEVSSLKQKLQSAEQAATSSDIKFKQLKQDVQSKTMIIQNQKEKIEEQEENIQNLRTEAEDQANHIKKLEAEHSDLKTLNSSLEKKLENSKQLVADKEEQIKTKINRVQSLEKEVSNQKNIIEGLEKTMKEKDKEIADQQAQLGELESMRKIIFEITGRKKK